MGSIPTRIGRHQLFPTICARHQVICSNCFHQVAGVERLSFLELDLGNVEHAEVICRKEAKPGLVISEAQHYGGCVVTTVAQKYSSAFHINRCSGRNGAFLDRRDARTEISIGTAKQAVPDFVVLYRVRNDHCISAMQLKHHRLAVGNPDTFTVD